MSIEKFTGLNGTVRLADFAGKGWIRCEERTTWNGNNHISMSTGSQWDHQRLNVRRHNGGLLMILEIWSQWQGSTPRNKEISIDSAKQWLAKNEYAGVEGFPELDIEVV